MADHRFFCPSTFIAGQQKPNQSIGSLLGEPVPPNVRHVDVWGTKGMIVWHTRSGVHEMEWPADGDVMPIIVAMRMSC